MPLVGLEPTISAGERPQTYALDRAATGSDLSLTSQVIIRYDSIIRLDIVQDNDRLIKQSRPAYEK